ncbi:MAG: type II secretion system major pseudopilin GspG [Paracoccaceae bacterium]
MNTSGSNPNPSATKRNASAGVTLLEVMIVLAIMVLVIGVAAPRFLDSFGRAKSQTALVQMANIKAAMQIYYLDVGRAPTAAQGLDALIRRPQGVQNWNGPYLDSAEGLTDPWGRRYQLRVPGEIAPFEIFSFGRDGQPGGEGEDRDIEA